MLAANTAYTAAEAAARRVVDGKAKPPGSLGRLEEWGVRLAALQRTLHPKVTAATLLVFAADHGVTRTHPAVSAYPRTVTPAMFAAIAGGQAASSVLCAANDCFLDLIDVGVDADVTHMTAAPGTHTRVMHNKVCFGSASFVSGPSMTQQQCQQAMAAGAGAVQQACQHMQQQTAAATRDPNSWSDSRCVICVGELGIGNTTAAAALLSALSGATPQEVCGRGTGVDDRGLSMKQQVVTTALEVNKQLIQSGPLGALQAVGGLELAAMVGAFTAAADRQMPVIVDGFISGTAALAAVRHRPDVSQCLFMSHVSAEGGAQLLLKELGQLPALDMGLRLGEGTGAVLSLPLLRSAAAVVSDMGSLDDVLAAAAAAATETPAAH